jgi:hypothetical protein
MKDDPYDVMPIWQIVAIGLFGMASLGLADLARRLLAPLAKLFDTTPRVICPNCHYRMPVIEQHCPECRQTRRAENA